MEAIKNKPETLATYYQKRLDSISTQLELDIALAVIKMKPEQRSKLFNNPPSLETPHDGVSRELVDIVVEGDNVLIQLGWEPFTHLLTEFSISDRIELLEAIEGVLKP